MNNERRKVIAEIIKMAEEMAGRLSDIASQIESLKDEEKEAFDNMPESLQQSERGQVSEAAIASLEDAHEEANSAFEATESICSNLDGAANG